ncbi:SDR family oxidoreductase [Dactylosporangium sp. CA-052675]|uniref:SDR family oxidoreductase n=1 Tax=Dactylosporangium sp. CA-052675 TaxID=3239927 RepID=UPI003D90F32E
MGVLDGRRVLVTGGSAGLGAAVARRVVADGGRVAVLGRDAERLEAIAEELGAVTVAADLSDGPAAAAAVDTAAERLGGLDALVNNAGTFRLGFVRDGEPSDWADMVQVNVLGLLAVTQAAVRHLEAGRAPQIVNVSSMGGRRVAQPAQGVYAATKHAVHALTESLRRELYSSGIRVTVIAPGFVHTNLGAYIRDPDVRANMEHGQLHQGLDPADVAAQIAHVLSAPPDVHHVEIALISTRQPPG